MNMLLHGIDAPCIEYQDTLADTFAQRFPDAQWHQYDPVNLDNVYAGAALAFGFLWNLSRR